MEERFALSVQSQGKRDYQQDAIFQSDDWKVFAVFDGMGGMAHGGIASEIGRFNLDVECRLGHRSPKSMKKALDLANAMVLDRVGKGSGSTAVVCCVMDEMVTFIWSGDSRAYLNGVQVTFDHEAGGRLYAGLGVSTTLHTDYSNHPIKKGDRITLCSDGAYRDHGDGWIKGLKSDRASCDSVKKFVLKSDHSDNCSVIHVVY